MKEEVKQPLAEQKVQKGALKKSFKEKWKNFKRPFINFDNSVRNQLRKFFAFFTKDIIKLLIFHGIIYGAILNYVLWIIFHIPFLWYGFPAYGIFLYLIKSEFIQIWKDIWFRSE